MTLKLFNFNPTRKFQAVYCTFVLAVFLSGIIFTQQSYGASAKAIDASVDATLERFYEQVKDGKEVVARAKGLLILPDVGKAAFIIGAEYGRGALRVGGKTVDYYNMITGSIGLQIGGQAKDIIIAFNSDEALKSFRASKGWEAGVDGNVALVTLGGGQNTLSAMNENPIVAFVFDVKGLIADMSIKGAKFTKLDMSE
jgi:lipid-binding SYLF domain-containing protein